MVVIDLATPTPQRTRLSRFETGTRFERTESFLSHTIPKHAVRWPLIVVIDPPAFSMPVSSLLYDAEPISTLPTGCGSVKANGLPELDSDCLFYAHQLKVYRSSWYLQRGCKLGVKHVITSLGPR